MNRIITVSLALLAVLLTAAISCSSREIDQGGLLLETAIERELVLVSGYLRLDSTGTDDSYLLLWPEGYSWHSDDREILVDDADGHTMAGVWDIIVVSGKETTRAVAEEYIGKELDAWVKGPYWLVKKVVSRSSRTYISRDEAVDIASDIIPPEVTERAKITAILRPELGPSGLWQIQHRLARVTRSELGWQEDDRTRFEPDVGASLTGWEIVYPNLIITIDARTGDIVSRTATSGVLLGGGVPEIPLYPKPREQ